MPYDSDSQLHPTDFAERLVRVGVRSHRSPVSGAAVDVHAPCHARALGPAAPQLPTLSVSESVCHDRAAALAVSGVLAEPCAVEWSVVPELQWKIEFGDAGSTLECRLLTAGEFAE